MRKQATVRFYAELNDFLAPWRRGGTTSYAFEVSGSIKGMIETLGVPHTEVDLILVNGEPEDFTYRLRNGDRISVYPVFESIDISALVRCRPQPLRESRFVADTHLGRLVRYLRMLGFDTEYRDDTQDEELAAISSNERRILLTRDRGLLKRNVVTRGYWVRATDSREQLEEVLQRFDLSGAIAPFSRCVHCNSLLRPTQKPLICHRLPPKTAQCYEEFHVCPGCERIYWKGSHYRRMQRFLEELLARE
jgi:uncharacterized protein with PIN domain